MTRSGFYAWQRRPESTHARRDRHLRVLVRASHDGSRRAYGSPRVGEAVSRKRVVRLMPKRRWSHARGAVSSRRRRATTISRWRPSVLDRQFTAAAPSQRWVGDTSEFLVGTGNKATRANGAVVAIRPTGARVPGTVNFRASHASFCQRHDSATIRENVARIDK